MLRALLLGDAVGVYNEAYEALDLFGEDGPDAIAAVNNIGVNWPGNLDYWCTLHPAPARDWVGIEAALRQRLKMGRNRPEIWAHKRASGVDKDIPDWAGASGLFGTKVLRFEGFERIVLAGVPMNREGAHFYAPDKPWETAGSFHKGWEKHMDQIKPYVRSMSGWTKIRLGAPTAEWLAG